MKEASRTMFGVEEKISKAEQEREGGEEGKREGREEERGRERDQGG